MNSIHRPVRSFVLHLIKIRKHFLLGVWEGSPFSKCCLLSTDYLQSILHGVDVKLLVGLQLSTAAWETIMFYKYKFSARIAVRLCLYCNMYYAQWIGTSSKVFDWLPIVLVTAYLQYYFAFRYVQYVKSPTIPTNSPLCRSLQRQTPERLQIIWYSAIETFHSC